MKTTEPMTEARLAELKREHAALEQEAADLRKYVADMERKVEAARSRLIEIQGGNFNRNCLLRTKKVQIERAEEDLRYQAMPPAVWIEEPSHSSDWRIEKVTPKLVYLRQSGSSRATCYSRMDGILNRSNYREGNGILDVAACIAALENSNV